jgi:hypothetical protein
MRSTSRPLQTVAGLDFYFFENPRCARWPRQRKVLLCASEAR